MPFAARTAAAAAMLVGALLVGGCGDLDDPAAAQGVSHDELVAELATALAGSATLTYTATYQLSGGETGTIAQDPPRSAYRYPGGAVLQTPDGTTRCAATTCTRTPPQTGTAPNAAGQTAQNTAGQTAQNTAGQTALFADAQRAGLVPPAALLAMLNEAASDPDLTVEQSDTTIAGRHATCLALGNVDAVATGQFRTCITNDGVIGSFTGTIAGRPVDVAMTYYAETVAADAFALPRE